MRPPSHPKMKATGTKPTIYIGFLNAYGLWLEKQNALHNVQNLTCSLLHLSIIRVQVRQLS